jgi:hypothetical protein
MVGYLRARDQDRAPGPEVSSVAAAARVTEVTQSSRDRYFLMAVFALPWVGFMVFLSFFCEVVPLPMFPLLLDSCL